jgi:CBS domain-containing protein
MSARAAWRLEGLGFTNVHHYGPGKMDWFAAGLPRAGKIGEFPRAGDALRRDVPTCRPDESVGQAAERAHAGGWDLCVVVNEHRVVLGVPRKRALEGDPERAAGDAMDPGPTTFRPSELLAQMALHLTGAGVKQVLVTTNDGELLGVLERDEAMKRTARSVARALPGEDRERSKR